MMRHCRGLLVFSAILSATHGFSVHPVRCHRQRLQRVHAQQTTASNKHVVRNYETFGDGALAEETFAELYKDHLPDWLTSRPRSAITLA